MKVGGKRKNTEGDLRDKREEGGHPECEEENQETVLEGRGSQFFTGHNFHQNTFIVHAHSYSIQVRLSKTFQIGLA